MNKIDISVRRRGVGRVGISLALAAFLLLPILARAGSPIGLDPGVSYLNITESYVSRVKTADFNADNSADIFLPFRWGQFAILTNDGTGLFTEQAHPLAGRFHGSAVVSLPGDSYPDLVFGEYDSEKIIVLEGNGDGTFTEKSRISSGSVEGDILAADLDGDGNQDLAYPVYNGDANQDQGPNGAVRILWGDGQGGFGNLTELPHDAYFVYLDAGHLNGDGHLDLFIANLNMPGTGTVFLGNGGRSFAPGRSFEFGRNSYCVKLADLNGDGNLDAVAGSDSSVRIALGDGAGGFWTNKETNVLFKRSMGNHFTISVHDMNGDGWLDVVVPGKKSLVPGGPQYLTGFLVFMNLGRGHLTDGFHYVREKADTLAVADFDNSGIPDVAVAHDHVVDGRMTPFFGTTVDSDLDVLSDADEVLNGTSVSNPDTDGDGMPDGLEVHYGCLLAKTADANLDPDNDLLSNLDEYYSMGDPCSFDDKDEDMVPDWFELANGCLMADTADASLDADGDGVDNIGEFNAQTDPCRSDPVAGAGDNDDDSPSHLGCSSAAVGSAGASGTIPLLLPLIVWLGIKLANGRKPRLSQ